LSNIPALTKATSVPRLAGINYPVGLPLGRPGDTEDHLRILREVLIALEKINMPGGQVILPFEWQKEPPINTHPDESPPIVGYLQNHPWQLPWFFNRDVPE